MLKDPLLGFFPLRKVLLKSPSTSQNAGFGTMEKGRMNKNSVPQTPSGPYNGQFLQMNPCKVAYSETENEIRGSRHVAI